MITMSDPLRGAVSSNTRSAERTDRFCLGTRYRIQMFGVLWARNYLKKYCKRSRYIKKEDTLCA